jgi:hypothetical protein
MLTDNTEQQQEFSQAEPNASCMFLLQSLILHAVPTESLLTIYQLTPFAVKTVDWKMSTAHLQINVTMTT